MPPRKSSKLQARPTRTANRHRQSGRAYQGARETHGQGTRQTGPVTSGQGAPSPREGRSGSVQATVYQKHRAVPNREMTHTA